MKISMNELLLSIDRMSNQIKPLDALITKVVQKVAPQLTAQAGDCNTCNPPAGFDYCCGITCKNLSQDACFGKKEQVARYARGFSVCNVPGQYVECLVGCCSS